MLDSYLVLTIVIGIVIIPTTALTINPVAKFSNGDNLGNILVSDTLSELLL